MRLDRGQPFSEILGLPGAAFEQDGHLFNARGDEVQRVEGEPDEDGEPTWRAVRVAASEPEPERRRRPPQKRAPAADFLASVYGKDDTSDLESAAPGGV